ncbi:uncharacterized protein LOC115068293 [Nannospalax galili]|uniref:uncharacterized protein LOC115068293 n=1 Tax=Nannospalax galili TaxID=1026970 RepID=UPI00111BFF9E|nr:uncharacterized protein LOC115068293 [Nannospalax galili]
MRKPDGPQPPPSSLHPSISPSLHPSSLLPFLPPSGARGLAALRRDPGRPPGPARPGSPGGKGCLCLKVTTRSAVPGLGLVAPIPRPTELQIKGSPKSPEVTGVGAPLFAPFDPQETARLRDQPAEGARVPSFHCLQAKEIGRPSGLHPQPFLPRKLAELSPPILPVTPRKTWEGGAGDMRQERGVKASAVPHPAIALVSTQKKGGEQGEGRGSPKQIGGGSPTPPPRGTFALAPLLRSIVSPGGSGREPRSKVGDPSAMRGCPLARSGGVAGETRDGGVPMVVGADHQKKKKNLKKIQLQQRQ